MRIAFVNATTRWGGVKTWMLNFGEGLVRLGHDVRVYGRQPEFVEDAQRRVGHGQRMDFGMDLNPCAIVRFCHEFKQHDTQVVILNVGKDLATAGVAAHLMGIPVVQRIGLPNDIPLRLKTRLLHQWIRPTFLSPCRYIADGFAASLPYLSGFKQAVVLNAKNPTHHPLAVHSPRKMVMTQQLFADKGHATILHAIALLVDDVVAERCADFQLHVVGTGGEEAELKALCAGLGLDSRVIWHGFSTDVAAHLADADIFILASTEEGLPNTLLEGMAAGLLPISRDVGGVKEVLPEFLAPWLLPFPSDAAKFSHILRNALTLDAAGLLSLRTATREATGDLDKQVNELASFLKGLVDKTPS